MTNRFLIPIVLVPIIPLQN